MKNSIPGVDLEFFQSLGPLGWRCSHSDIGQSHPQRDAIVVSGLEEGVLEKVSFRRGHCLETLDSPQSGDLLFPYKTPHFSPVMCVFDVDLRPSPKGPFRTKNPTALNSIVFYYCRSFLLSVAICCLISLYGGVEMSAVVFYYRRSEFTTDSKFTIRSVFSTGGTFNSLELV